MREPNAPATRFQAVSLAGGVVTFSPPARMLVLGTGGVLNMRAPKMTARALTNEIPAGDFVCECAEIDPSGTTAEQITALW